MKKIMTLLAFLFSIATVTNAQIRSIPAAVTTAFQQKFPSAADVSWRDHVSNFEASFNMDGHKYDAHFSSKGDLKRTEKYITFDDLPASVKNSFSNSKYASGWETGSVAEVDDNKDGFFYRVFVQKNIVQKKFIYFNKDGKLVKEGNI